MPRSGYIAAIRQRVGGALVLVPSVTACIFDDQDRLLLLRHADRDVWATPGGTIEPGESPADAVVRECREELDVLVEPTAILGVFGGPEYEVRYDNGDRTAYVMTAFDCRITRGDVRPDDVEAYEARFVADGEWRDLRVSQWAFDALPRLYRQRMTGSASASFTPPRRSDGTGR